MRGGKWRRLAFTARMRENRDIEKDLTWFCITNRNCYDIGARGDISAMARKREAATKLRCEVSTRNSLNVKELLIAQKTFIKNCRLSRNFCLISMSRWFYVGVLFFAGLSRCIFSQIMLQILELFFSTAINATILAKILQYRITILHWKADKTLIWKL